ncbi:MAG: type transport system ATP-binding protein [Solirubrobacteraceae bacterium]|jgi:ABC-2 type transport system ATP-binding protein|nr:type transport system ATP-binding protein [Solirubrobacteraceae bacterium]
MPGSVGAVLELDDLHRRYGEVAALDGLTFTVPAGKVFGFLGPNGAGKTTAMRAVLGVTALDSGSIRFADRPVDPVTRRRFGYMPEERGLYPGMKVLDQVEYFGRLHSMDAAAAERSGRAILERLGLADRVESKVEELSLGNQQRVQLAAALVHDPELLVLDEPFSGLDPVGIDELSAVLGERARDGVTVLFSSHQLDLVEHLCEEVAIIDHGYLVAHGSVDDLARGGRPHLAVRVAGDREGRWASSLPPGARVKSVDGGTVAVALDGAGRADAVLDAARAGGMVEHFAFERRRLSEVFRESMGRAGAER